MDPRGKKEKDKKKGQMTLTDLALYSRSIKENVGKSRLGTHRLLGNPPFAAAVSRCVPLTINNLLVV